MHDQAGWGCFIKLRKSLKKLLVVRLKAPLNPSELCVGHIHGLASPFKGHFAILAPLPHKSGLEPRWLGSRTGLFSNHVHYHALKG